MIQQINLARYFISKKQVDALNWQRLWLINFAFIGLLILYYIVSWMGLEHDHLKIRQMTKQAATIEQQYKTLQAQFPSKLFKQDFETTVKQIHHDLALQSDIIKALGNSIYFSDILLGLSQSAVDMSWLTDITIANQGNSIELQGQSIEQYKLHEFMQNLLKTPVFKTFNLHIDVVKLADQTNNIKFKITLVRKEKTDEIK
jgi:Tfp pilus assembly protein PilN